MRADSPRRQEPERTEPRALTILSARLTIVVMRDGSSPFGEADPQMAEARRLFGAGDFAGAVLLSRRLLKRRKNDPAVLSLLGSSLLMLGQSNEAREMLRRSLKFRPSDVGVHHDLALTYKREGRFKEAHASLDAALKLRPGEPRCLAAKAQLYHLQGQPELARETLRPALESGDPMLVAATAFSRLAASPDDRLRAIAAIEQSLSAHGSVIPDIAHADALFHLAKLHEQQGDYDRAFEVCAEANRLKHARFDPAEFERGVDLTIAGWSEDNMKRAPRSAIADESPVFIVGMPRSGTTLVEQILSSHPCVVGVGEHGGVSRLLHAVADHHASGMPMVTTPGALSAAWLSRSAAAHLAALRKAAPGATRIVDKTLGLEPHLGVIALLLPGARIIRLTRDALDIGVSCFFHHFSGNLPFAYNLEHLGVYHRAGQRLMRHWSRTLPLPMLHVSYEELVTDQERISRRIIEHLGLEWDDRCLRFYENDGRVLTASHEQVRRPMSGARVGRWRNYERRLEPLRSALEARGDETRSDPVRAE